MPEREHLRHRAIDARGRSRGDGVGVLPRTRRRVAWPLARVMTSKNSVSVEIGNTTVTWMLDAGQLGAHALGEADLRELGRGIRAHVRNAALADDRRDDDDVAALLAAEDRQRGARGVERCRGS